MTAPNDPTFHYEPIDHPRWRWRVLRTYGFALPPERYPTLYAAARDTLTTEAKHPDGFAYGYVAFFDNAPTVEVRKDYAWDGSSGGTEVEAGRRASCLHDTLYQIMRRYELDWPRPFRDAFRADADRLFLDVQRDDGMSWWRRWTRWLAVRTWPGNVRRQGMAVYGGDKGAVRG